MASNNIARLGVVLGIDTAAFTADVDKAISENKKLKTAIERDSKAAAGAIADLKNATDDYGKTLTKVEQIQREMSSGRYMNATASAKQQLLEQAVAYDKVALAAKNVTGAQFKMNEQQKMGLTYQTTDFFTQIASGSNPMIAFIQQGGQLKDQMGGVGNAMKAVGSLITPLSVGITTAVAVFGSLAFAIFKGKDEFDKLKDTLILTNNYAGITTDKFAMMARTIAGDTSVSIGKAKDIMSALVSSGQFTEKTLISVGDAIAKVSRLTGESADEAAQRLIPAFDGTALSAKKLNQQYNFLTLEQYKQIDALERQGKKQEVIKLQADLLLESYKNQERQLGILEAAWNSLGKMASSAWNSMLNIGKPEDLISQLESLNSEIVKTTANIAQRKTMGFNTQLLEAELAKMQTIFQEKTQKLVSQYPEEKKVDSKAKIDEFVKYQELYKTKANDVEKSKIETNFARQKEGANELMLLEIETGKKVAEAKQEMVQSNIKEEGRATTQNLEIYKNKVIAVSLEAAEKVRQMNAKIAQKEYQEKVDFEKDLSDARVAEDNRRSALTAAAQATSKTLDIEKERLELKTKMIFATEKDQKLALISFEYARKRKEVEGTQDQEELTKQLRRQEALERFNVEIEDNAKKLKEMYDSVLGNMGSAIDNFVKTGKLSFKDLARSIIQDLIAIQMKAQATGMFNMLMRIMGGYTPGGSSASNLPDNRDIGGGWNPNAAGGGDLAAGKIGLVGELGPELFVPKSAGTIIPNNAMGSMGGTTNVTNNYINAIDTKSFEQRLLGSSSAIWAANKYGEKNLASSFGRT
jgi:lambda family phage tail tape measure protein